MNARAGARAPNRRAGGAEPPTGSVGVDVGGTKCLGIALDPGGGVAAERRVDTPAGADNLLAVIAELVEDLRGAAGPSPPVGVGVPGLVDDSGFLRFAPNLPGVVELAVGESLRVRLGASDGAGAPFRRVRVENDASCAGWGEAARGAAAGHAHVLLATLGTGIGGGLVSDGRLLRGAHGFAGEIGHMVVDPGGPLCPCGKRGCWERYASGSGLGRLAREAAHAGRVPELVALAGGDPEAVRGEHVTQAAAAGDEGARAVLSDFAWWLALGLANLANVLDPEVIVIGGGLVASGELLLEPTREAFVGLVEGAAHRPAIDIVGAVLGERAGAVGAALLALEDR